MTLVLPLAVSRDSLHLLPKLALWTGLSEDISLPGGRSMPSGDIAYTSTLQITINTLHS